MAHAGKKSPPSTEGDSCFICQKEFSSNRDLAEHLVDHTNEPKYKLLLEKLESRLSEKRTGTAASTRRYTHVPEFIYTDLRKPLKRKYPNTDDKPATNVVSSDNAVSETENLELIVIRDYEECCRIWQSCDDVVSHSENLELIITEDYEECCRIWRSSD